MMTSSLPNLAKPLLHFRQAIKISPNFSKTLSIITKMSSWTCSKCTFINSPAQKSCCEICLSAPPQQLVLSSSSSSAPSPPPELSWSCSACTFLNPYSSTICEICGTRATATRLSTLEIDDDDDDADENFSVGSVFLPLKTCSSAKKENTRVGGGSASPSARIDCGNFGNGRSKCVDNRGSTVSDDREKMGFYAGLRPCSNKRKDRDEDDGGDNGGSGVCGDGAKRGFSAGLRPCSNKGKDREEDDGDDDAGGSSGFQAVKASNKAVLAKPLGGCTAAGEAHLCSEPKTWKLLSYNVWFREDVEMHKRMRALGNLIELHSPDVICFQEVTPSFYEIFQKSSWWKGYRCSMPDDKAYPGAYFCIQLSRLPVKSYSSRPFHNSIMGRELCVAEVEVLPGTTLVVATSHLESPCPSPPTWDQMFSKERVVQANEAVKLLAKNENVIFCGDMNWDDKLDGPFPLGEGWVDAWTELRPGDVGWTYDTKSNKMLSGNRSLQKRLDRFICKLKELKVSSIEMIGRDAISGASYIKEKRVKGQVKELTLPVLPSDHYGLLLTISRA